MDNKMALLKSRPGFGMSLNTNLKKIEKEMGKYIADEVRKASPRLEKLAKDVDIFVEPLVISDDITTQRLKVYVQNITKPYNKSKNPILNFIRKLKMQVEIDNKKYIDSVVYPYSSRINSISETLVDRTSTAVNMFKHSPYYKK